MCTVIVVKKDDKQYDPKTIVVYIDKALSMTGNVMFMIEYPNRRRSRKESLNRSPLMYDNRCFSGSGGTIHAGFSSDKLS